MLMTVLIFLFSPSTDVPDDSNADDDDQTDMNTIEVKLAGMHSNIGCMEADLAEADLRASLILEEPPPDLDLDVTADKEKLLADTNALLEGHVAVDVDVKGDSTSDDREKIVADSNELLESGVDVDLPGDDTNSTSALLEEIAQTIHAIEEAGGGDDSGGGMNFSLEMDDDEEEELDVPKLDLGDMSEDSDTIPEEDEDVEEEDDDADTGVKGGIDLQISGASTKALAGSIAETPNDNAHINGSLKADVDFNIGEPKESDLSDDDVKASVPIVEGNLSDDMDIASGDIKAPSSSAKIDVDLEKAKTKQIDDVSKVKVPSANVEAKTSNNINTNVANKKKKSTKGSFHFHFPWFGSKKPPTSKHADVSLDTDDLIGDIPNNGPQVTMVAGVKDGGNTATLHVVTEPQFKTELTRSASFEVKPPKKPPRDPSVDSSDISGLELDVDLSFQKPSCDVNGGNLNGTIDMPDADVNIEGPSLKIEPQMDVDVKPDIDADIQCLSMDVDLKKEADLQDPSVDVDLQKPADIQGPFMEIDLQREANVPEPSIDINLQKPGDLHDPSMEINFKQDANITLTKPEGDIEKPDPSMKLELEHDTNVDIPHVNGDVSIKGTPDIGDQTHPDTDGQLPHVNGQIEAPGPSGGINVNGIQKQSTDLDIDMNAPKAIDVKVDDKSNKLKKDLDVELDIKAKRRAKQERKARHKRKAFTLPSLHFKSSRDRAARNAAQLEADARLEANGRMNGGAVQMDMPDVSTGGRLEADGQVSGEASAVVKADVPDVSADVAGDGSLEKSFGARLPGDGSSDTGSPVIDVDVKGK